MLEDEYRALKKFGVKQEDIDKYQILILPENLEDVTNREELFDANDSVLLSKILKGQGVSCANSLDLGLKPDILERKSHDIWLGLVQIIDIVALPFFVNILSNLCTPKVDESDKSSKKESPQVHIKIKIKTKKGCNKIKYDGDAETLLKMFDPFKDRNDK